MEAGPQRNRAIGLTVAAVGVLAASFMPWGEIRGGGAGPFGAMLEGLGLSLTVTAWNGSITVLGVKIPNWLVVVAAAGAAVVAWLKVARVWEPPAALLYALAGYGLFHSVWVVLALMFSSRGALGIGSLLTAAAFVGMLVAVRGLIGRGMVAG